MRGIILAFLLLTGASAFAQWECRSHLIGNIKPLYNGSNLGWGAELIESGGYLTNREIASSMAFWGVNYTLENHQLYAEGGFKYWYNKDLDLGYTFTKRMFGLRDLSYGYSAPKFDARIGFHQMGASDYFLVNERAWGASLNKTLGGFRLSASAATVTKDFARNGIFCTNSYLFDIVSTHNYTLGNSWGDTNFASFAFSKKKTEKKAAPQTDSDGFEVFEPTGETDNKSRWGVNSWGGVFYSEFGNFYEKSFVYGGLMTEIALGNLATVKAEGIYQDATDNRAVLYYLEAEKQKEWKAGNVSTFQFLFIGKHAVDEGALAMPRFSNLFLGEVFRMDLIDVPLINVSAKHQFRSQQLSLKLNYSEQLQGENMQELDFSAGKFFFDKRLRLTALTGLMKSDELESWAKLARLEMRIFF